MNVVKWFSTPAVTLAAIALATPANAVPYAWVSGYFEGPGPSQFTTTDQGDDTPGLFYDDMVACASFGGCVEGWASTGSASVGLFASAYDSPEQRVSAFADIVDDYLFVDQNDPDFDGLRTVLIDIAYDGSISRSSAFPVATASFTACVFGFSSCSGGVALAVTDSGPASGVISVPWQVQFGTPFEIRTKYSANAYSGVQVDFLSTAAVSFRIDDPQVALAVTSAGGFSQGVASAPEPLTGLLLAAGIVAVGLRAARARRPAKCETQSR